jgi:hypothetical protein
LLDHHGETEGEKKAQDGIGAVEAAEEEALEDYAKESDQYRRGDEGADEPEVRGEHHGEIGADGVKPAMS